MEKQYQLEYRVIDLYDWAGSTNPKVTSILEYELNRAATEGFAVVSMNERKILLERVTEINQV